MEPRHQVCRRLHEEHVAVLDLLNRFGQERWSHEIGQLVLSLGSMPPCPPSR